ncbi:MAG: hypothetical protein LUF35_05915 [Lachnospiraceae bacterium]|nr:hypothetical protein [Lachnospiraceae bacterium]
MAGGKLHSDLAAMREYSGKLENSLGLLDEGAGKLKDTLISTEERILSEIRSTDQEISSLEGEISSLLSQKAAMQRDNSYEDTSGIDVRIASLRGRISRLEEHRDILSRYLRQIPGLKEQLERNKAECRDSIQYGLGIVDKYLRLVNAMDDQDSTGGKSGFSGVSARVSGAVGLQGGSYKDVFQGGQGDKYEVHHMPADSASFLAREDGPAIRMEKEDHRKTASCGSSREARNYRAAQKNLISQGKFKEALQMDIDDVKEKCGDKYNAAIGQMMQYVGQLEKDGKIK